MLIEDKESRIKSFPKMSQPHFIALWKTLYDIFQTESEDQETYHSIATIGKIVSRTKTFLSLLSYKSVYFSNDQLLKAFFFKFHLTWQ